ncbi:cell division protein FtsB [Piscirickettsia litoralis]|uniref:Cell division protein FtsB n=1 Tax=Piscirickettsia litoralis TaxID=1891921 RepID=A0ABX2ZZN3_9GAMM|nr:cell division protein FtsB [Piscirickettsia litoralis]ODN42017.1 septum formation initiator family protein [Piscirickettsia litoralis]
MTFKERCFVTFLGVLFLLLQFNLWVGKGSVANLIGLHDKINVQEDRNKTLSDRNEQLEAEILTLKQGNASIEARARRELGMIKPGETYYQIIGENKKIKRYSKINSILSYLSFIL